MGGEIPVDVETLPKYQVLDVALFNTSIVNVFIIEVHPNLFSVYFSFVST